jgi:hypothetical protein
MSPGFGGEAQIAHFRFCPDTRSLTRDEARRIAAD